MHDSNRDEFVLRYVSASPQRVELLAEIWQGFTGEKRARAIAINAAEARGAYQVRDGERSEYSPLEFAFAIHPLMGFWFGI